jgi:Fe-S cluster biogenesis protein NfuA
MRSLFSREGGTDAEPIGDPVRLAQVEAVLERLRPAFRADGGDITLVEVDEAGLVTVALHGACSGCHASSMTLHGALEPELRRSLDWVSGLQSA